MKQSKGYRVLAIIHGLIAMCATGAMYTFSALEMQNEMYAAGFVTVTAVFSMAIYEVMHDKAARREWRTIK